MAVLCIINSPQTRQGSRADCYFLLGVSETSLGRRDPTKSWLKATTFLETGTKQEAEPSRVMVPITGKHGETAGPAESQLTWIGAVE